MSGHVPKGLSAVGKRPILHPNTPRQKHGVSDGPCEGDPDLAERERQDEDFEGRDHIFWVTSEPVGAASWNCSATTMVTARPAQNWRSSRVNTGFLTFDPYWVTRTRATTRSSHGFEGRQASLSRRVTPAAATASGAGCRSSLFVRSFGCGIPCQRGISARFSRKPSFRHCQYISKDVVITRFLHQTISSLFSTFLDLFGLRHGAVDAHWHKAHMDQIITSVRVIEWE